ncbi:MAG: IS200/IS605 family transposase [Gammaproteobacteria bacterium]
MVATLRNRNCVYQTAYHVIWCPKYRRRVLSGDVSQSLDDLLDAICTDRSWPVITKKIQPDHIHLFLTIPPAIAVADAVKILKGTTARRLLTDFPGLKDTVKRDGLWSPSYFVSTAGNVAAATIQRYIERSEHIRGRH